jgi:hypothetical protein
VILDALMDQPPRLVLRVDRHPAYGVQGQSLRSPRELAGCLEELDGVGDVSELAPSAWSEDHVGVRVNAPQVASAGSPGCGGGCLGHEDIASGGGSGHPRRQVDRGPEPIPASLDGGAGVEASTDARKAMPRAHLLNESKRECDRLGGRVAADHHRVAERLHLLRPVLAEQYADIREELPREVGRLLVPVGLGERGEARDVGEEKRMLGRLAT